MITQYRNKKIVTFYSYKGGVGRSMALANIAWLLANNYNKRVIMIDWDLEAPGLHRFFKIEEKDVKTGLMDLLICFKEILSKEIILPISDLIKIENYLYPISVLPDSAGSLKILTAGNLIDNYSEKVNSFDWDDFYENWNGGGVIEHIKEELESHADYILIDSRTGLTDIGGICTLQLPDLVVLCFVYNEQNLRGIEKIANIVLNQKGVKNKPEILLVPTRVHELEELTRREEWEKIAIDILLDYIKEDDKTKYLKTNSIPFVSFFNYGEDLAVKLFPDDLLSVRYKQICFSIINQLSIFRTPSWVINIIEENKRNHVDIIIFDQQNNKESLEFFPEELLHFDWLKSLYFYNCKIKSFPLKFQNSSIVDLKIINSNLSEILFIEGLTTLNHLDLSFNQIIDIESICNQTNLIFLNLSNNFIEDCKQLAKLQNLQVLDLSNNQICDLHFLKKLKHLKSINLSNNQINDINEIVPLLKKGLTISFEKDKIGNISLWGNPILNPPIEIFIQGRVSILKWFEQINEFGAEPFYESKLMILGQGGAGKTTFANSLLDPNYDVKSGRLDSTLGIVVNRGKTFPHAEKEKPNIKAHLWDFGGQDIQKMLHQFFITENCLYVLVSDKRAENTNFDYWFQIINLFGSNSTVIVLENTKENNRNNEYFALNKYRELFPLLNIDSFEVNLSAIRGKHSKRWEKLNEMISEKLSKMELVNRMVPRSWGLVRNALKKMKGKKHIRKDEFYKLCEVKEIGLNKRQADWCLSYFRSLGDLVYFDDLDLCTHIFLDQNWLTQSLYFILSDKKIEDNGGRFTLNQAFTKWDSNQYSEEEKVMLINLLLKDKFDICYELPNSKNVFITPLLLTADKPGKWEHETQLRFRYQYGFIPHGLFSRLIVQLNEKIDSEQHWKTGFRLKIIVDSRDVYAEVQQYNDPEDNMQVIDIKISGKKNGCKQMLTFIRAAVVKLHKDFRNINVKQLVACNCDTCIERMKKGGKPSFYDYEMLWDKLINRSYFVDCKESKWKEVNIGQILNDVVIEKAGKENQDVLLLNLLKETGMSFNKIINTSYQTNTINSNAIAFSKNSNTITISIQNMIGEVEMMKEDVVRELKIKKVTLEDIEFIVSDIEIAETALKEIEISQLQNKELNAKSAKRLTQVIDDLSDENSTLHNGLKLLRKGRDYGVNLAETYNQIAGNMGMPLVPPLALEVIKKI